MELWQGPGYTPRRMRVYSEDGRARPFRTEMGTGPYPNTLAVRNTGPMEFPMDATVVGGRGMPVEAHRASAAATPSTTIQGGAERNFPVDSSVESVQVHLSTEGRNLQVKIELLQGPNNVKQSIELDEDDGYNRPFSCTFDTLGYGCVVRIENTGPMEFPITASVVPQRGTGRAMYDDRRPMMGGGGGYTERRGRYDRGYGEPGWWESPSGGQHPGARAQD